MYFPLSFWSSSSSSMDYFWKGDEFSWMYEFAKGIGGTIICLLNRHLFLRHPNPKQKKI